MSKRKTSDSSEGRKKANSVPKKLKVTALLDKLCAKLGDVEESINEVGANILEAFPSGFSVDVGGSIDEALRKGLEGIWADMPKGVTLQEGVDLLGELVSAADSRVVRLKGIESSLDEVIAPDLEKLVDAANSQAAHLEGIESQLERIADILNAK